MRVGAILVAIAGLLIGFAISCSGGKKPGCKADKDCANNKAGTHCVANKCVACALDTDCPKGQKCEANQCVVKPDCTKDDQCPNGQVCQAGKCKPCANDTDCGPGGSCDNGACKKATKCTQDTDCADDEDCIGGFCRKAGGIQQPPDVNCQLATIYFAFDDSSIQQSERDRLDANSKCLESAKGKGIYLVGHTDTSGTEEYNIALSERRAQSVADYLTRLGIDPQRLQVVPKGETEPTGLGDDKDRRCEFKWKQ